MSAALLKVEQVALYLGHPWKFNRLREPCNWSYEITDGYGRGLYFRVDGEEFRICGIFPREKTYPHHEDHVQIGVRISRPAKDIATDMMRRLIPDYLEAYARAVQRYKEEQQKEEHLTLMTQAIVRVTGGRVCEYSRGAKTVYFDNGKAELWSEHHITLELNRLSIEQTIQIAALLQQLKGGA